MLETANGSEECKKGFANNFLYLYYETSGNF